MTQFRSRRRLLRGAAAAVGPLLAGCAELVEPFEEDPPEGSIYVENPTRETKRIAVGVIELSDGETTESIVNGRFRLPEGHALSFEGVTRPGTTYRLTLRILDEPTPETGDGWEWTGQSCAEGDPSTTFDVSLIVRSEQVDFVRYGCDRPTSFNEELEYVDAAEYRLEAATPGTDAAANDTG